jgi:hypothetical protein
VVASIQTLFGRTVRRLAPTSLADRTDERGNIQPYAPDDAEVLSRMFGITEDDWERVV